MNLSLFFDIIEERSIREGKDVARIVLAAKSMKLVMSLRPHLVSAGFEIVAITDNQYELSRQIKAWSPEIVMIDDEISTIGISFIESLIFDQQAVLLLGQPHKRGYYQPSPYLELCDKPVQPNMLLMTLRMLEKYAATVKRLETKITRLEEQQKNLKLVAQAKRHLQVNHNMPEEEAHQYLTKRSMELRISKAELAKRILKNFAEKT